VKNWDAQRIADVADARLITPAPGGGPLRVVIDSREVAPGDLFVGLAGVQDDGGRFATQALAAGAWGVAVRPEFAPTGADSGAVLTTEDPLAFLQSLALAWRRELGAKVVGITGSAGKTSTKDMLAALLARERPTVASPRNYNTEIGLPLAILGAPQGTEVLVLELAMRGLGQIAELAAICEPDIGVIVNIGPAHLELLGSIEAIAAAKAELLAALADDATAVVPAGEPLLDPYLAQRLRVVRFGPGGDVCVLRADADGVEIDAFGEVVTLEPGFRSAHLLLDLCAAVAAAGALAVPVGGEYEIALSRLRGERAELTGGVTIINDCYNANPMSMRAALEELGSDTVAVRRVAVLGDMLELGAASEQRYHRELGEQAADARVSLLVTVGPLAELAGETFVGGEHVHFEDARSAASGLEPLLARGDLVLVKGSRGVGLEIVARQLALGRVAS
jgi:UDP-N-acetylmuramoyl-tripeptide--D-alanyl-D-alanine ligase